MTENLKAYLLCRYAETSGLYNSWMNELPMDFEVIEGCPADWQPPLDAGIVIGHEHYRWEEIHALRRIYEQRRVPVLMLADGVLEFRNTWQNPTIPDASIFQPLIAHKVACIGSGSARLIESWGNQGKTEIVGLPRLDALLSKDLPAIHRDGEFRILITTATTPAFTPGQRDTVIHSLTDLQHELDQIQEINGRPVKAMWRLTSGLDAALCLEPVGDDETSLVDAIAASDSVITTPSTIYLESALLNRPTALLDYSHSPQFVPSAWTISARTQIQAVLEELNDPPSSKMLFQDYILHDNLCCSSPAVPRMIKLITLMVEIAARQRQAQQPVTMPANLLSTQGSSTATAKTLNTSEFFPENLAFSSQDVARLQAELAQAVARLDTLPRELADKNRQITQLQTSLDESRRRVADVRSRLFKLRKILGIGKENQPQ